jgi:sugar phosphate isomerase/epimerase
MGIVASGAMKIGIAGWAFHRSILQQRSLTLLDFPGLARQEYGVETVELVSEFFESTTAGYLNRLRSVLEREHVTVHGIAVDQGDITNLDASARRTSLEALKQWFYVARAIGSAAIRVNTDDFEPLVDMLVANIPIPASAIGFGWAGLSASEREAKLERAIVSYAELARTAETTGIRLLLENHGGVTGEPANISRILGRIDSPWFATCPDNQNAYQNDLWEEGTRALLPRAFSVHAKVSGYDPNGIQTFSAMDGTKRTQDLTKFLAIVGAPAYRGPLFFEYNFAETDERVAASKGLAYLRTLVKADS